MRGRVGDDQPGILRFHSWESRYDSNEHHKGWADAGNNSWDEAKIVEILGAYQNVDHSILNVPGWSDWIDANNNNRLDRNEFSEYAAWCTDLVEIVNVKNEFGVRYFSPFNEMENKVEDGVTGLIDLFNVCYDSVKAVDADVQVGGGEWTQPWDSNIRTFIEGTRERLEWFGYHHYVTGDSEKPDAEIFDAASGFADRSNGIRGMMDDNGLQDKPLFLSEYNVFWSWDIDKNRHFMRSIKDAVFNALVLKHMAEKGAVDGCMIWNDSDNTYGVMSSDYDMRANAHLIHLKNQFLNGTAYRASSRKSSVVSALAVEGPLGKSVLLINRSDQDTTVNLAFRGWEPGSVMDLHYIDEWGYDIVDAVSPENFPVIDVPAMSLLLLKFPLQSAVKDCPERFDLLNVYPNPFNPTTRIEFSLKQPSAVDVEVFDIRGRRVHALGRRDYAAGVHQVELNAAEFSSGIYTVVVSTNQWRAGRKVTLLR